MIGTHECATLCEPWEREVLATLIEHIVSAPDDNEKWNDGYQRTPRLVRARSAEAAEEVLNAVERAVRATLGSERAREIAVVRCTTPPGKQRYDIGRSHKRAILRAAGHPHPERSAHRVYERSEWPHPLTLLFANADAMARIGRGNECTRREHSNALRLMADTTRVRTVHFGTEALYQLSFADTSTAARMHVYDFIERRD